MQETAKQIVSLHLVQHTANLHHHEEVGQTLQDMHNAVHPEHSSTIARAHLRFTLSVHTDGFICGVSTQDNSMASEVRQQRRIRRMRRPSVRWLSVLPLQTQQIFSIALCLLQPLWHPNVWQDMLTSELHGHNVACPRASDPTHWRAC